MRVSHRPHLPRAALRTPCDSPIQRDESPPHDTTNVVWRRSSRSQIISGMHVARLFAVIAVLVLSRGAGATLSPSSFQRVFDGKHNAELLHEGTFTTSLPLCLSGSAIDVSVEATTDTAVRRF